MFLTNSVKTGVHNVSPLVYAWSKARSMSTIDPDLMVDLRGTGVPTIETEMCMARSYSAICYTQMSKKAAWFGNSIPS